MVLLTLVLAPTPPAPAQVKKAPAEPTKGDPSLLTLDRVFSSREFASQKPPAMRWRKQGSSYVTQELSAGGTPLIAHDPVTGRREVLVPDHWFIPGGEAKPLRVDGYAFSDDGARLLIYTNSKRVWRVNSRGDYWLLDLSTRELKKLGGDIPPSTMMFATFSPDGKRVGYVHKNNLYVQDLARFSHHAADKERLRHAYQRDV